MKKSKWIFGLLLLCLIGMLAACQGEDKQSSESSKYKIYYLNNSQNQLVSESYELKGITVTGQLREFVAALNSKTPKDLTYRKALPDNVVLKVESNIQKGQLTVLLDSNYKTLTGTSEILCRAAIVKTLCQVEGVEYVQFLVDGQPLTNSSDVPIGFMTAEDFIDNTGGETKYEQNAQVTLFFASAGGDKLKETYVNITYTGTIPIEQLVIEQLIKGPENISGVEENQLFRCISKDTKLVRVTVKDDVCYADFDAKLLDKPAGITDEAVVYSIVNTLVELPEINKVQFTINGQKVKSFTEGMEFDISFERNLDIVERGE